jgi:hypothetical protein
MSKILELSDFTSDRQEKPERMEPPREFEYEWNQGYAMFNRTAAEAAVEAITNGHSLRAAAGRIGIPYGSIMRWLVTETDFAKMIDIASAQRVFHLEKLLLGTKDVVKYKVLMGALRRAAPEAWEETRVLPSAEAEQLPQTITVNIIRPLAPPPAPNIEGSDAIN